MATLHIEHQIRDFDTWKEAFDRDPAGRQQSGVRRYRVLRPIDDPNFVVIDLDFDSSREAEAFAAALHDVWRSSRASPALLGTPETRILEAVATEEY